jgi:DNA uptake protein ComE-like DNA-binding protein
MMMVVAVVAEILHLFPSYGQNPALSNPFLAPALRWAQNGAVRRRMLLAGFTAAVFAACLSLATGATETQSPSAAPHAAPKTKPAPPPGARLDLNRASIDELLKVPGMTASWAGRIVRFRPYRTKQDLLDRGVLPSEVYDRIKDYVIAHRFKD